MIGKKLPAIDGAMCEHPSFQEVGHYILWPSHLRLSAELPPWLWGRNS